MQKNIGTLLSLYPTPTTVIGAMVDGKPNWLLCAHVGIIGVDRVTVSLGKAHYTNKGIRKTGRLTIALVDEAMLPRADYVGTVSGNSTDKSHVFNWHEGEFGAPVINQAPLVMECEVVDDYQTEAFDTFILKILATYVQEDKILPNGRPDYELIAPVLFEMPTYSYVRSGMILEPCATHKELE